MFTRNIKQSVLLGKSGVRWQPVSAAPAEMPEAISARKALEDLKNFQ